MKPSRWERLAPLGLLIAWVIVCAAIATLFTGCGPDACQRRGGHWLRYNCRDTSYWAPDGNGNLWLVPDETCDRRCVLPRLH